MNITGGISEKGLIYKGRSLDGMIYKNPNEFHPKGGICYVPELTGVLLEGYPVPIGYDAVDGGIENVENGSFMEYAKAYKYEDFLSLAGGNEEIARLIFDTVTWEYPETAISDGGLKDIGIIPCDKCGYVSDIEDTKTCQKCGEELEAI